MEFSVLKMAAVRAVPGSGKNSDFSVGITKTCRICVQRIE